MHTAQFSVYIPHTIFQNALIYEENSKTLLRIVRN